MACDPDRALLDEALTNAVKHSCAPRIAVQIETLAGRTERGLYHRR